MALKYANAIYPFSSVFARYICLLGSSASIVKLDVKEEARRGLVPFTRNKYGLVENVEVISPTELPKFEDLVHYIHDHRPDENYSLMSKTPAIKGYPVEVYSEILRFLRMIWILQVNPTTILIDQYVADKVENSMSEDPVTMVNFKNSVTEMWSNDKVVIQYWLEFVEQGLDPELKGKNKKLFFFVKETWYSLCFCDIRFYFACYFCQMSIGGHLFGPFFHCHYLQGSSQFLQITSTFR
jgi:proteasome component ECM29